MTASPIMVLGMHRSGTSCLAGCLQDLGLNLGDVNTEAPHNKKGNREDPRFWPVHDAVLARVGAAWDNPPSEPVVWTRDEKTALTAVLAEYDSVPHPWGFKDPRATVLLDGWLEVLPDLRMTASIRHPLSVAGSLAARNGFLQEKSLAIWRIYNQAVLDWHSRRPFDVVDYDAPDYESRVRAMAAGLGLDSGRPMPFRDGDLNHQIATAPPPAEAAGMWEEMRAVAQ